MSVVGGHVSWANVVVAIGLVVVVILIGRTLVKHRVAVKDKFSKLFSPPIDPPNQIEIIKETPPLLAKLCTPIYRPKRSCGKVWLKITHQSLWCNVLIESTI